MIITDDHIAQLSAVTEDKRIGLMLLWLYNDDVLDDEGYADAIDRAAMLAMDAVPADDDALAAVGGRS